MKIHLSILALLFLILSVPNVSAQYGGGGCPNCPTKPAVTTTSSCNNTTPTIDVSWTPASDPNTTNYEIWKSNGSEKTQGDGVYGFYYKNSELTGLYDLRRIDASIDSTAWTQDKPDPSFGSTFSVRWNGYILIPQNGKYTLTVRSNGGVVFYFNYKREVNKWNNKSDKTFDTKKNLTGGEKYPFSLQFKSPGSSPIVQLSWSGPQASGIIGQNNLFTSTLNYQLLSTQTTSSYSDTQNLIPGTAYSYQVIALGPNGTSSGISPATPARDCQAPIVSLNSFLPACFTPNSWSNAQPIKVTASDESSGVASVNIRRINLTNNTSSSFAAANNPLGPSIWEYDFRPPPVTDQLTLDNKYRLEATATDNDTPPKTSAPYLLGEFDYSTCLGPWIQTTGGDVHSNIEIYTPGGP